MKTLKMLLLSFTVVCTLDTSAIAEAINTVDMSSTQFNNWFKTKNTSDSNDVQRALIVRLRAGRVVLEETIREHVGLICSANDTQSLTTAANHINSILQQERRLKLKAWLLQELAHVQRKLGRQHLAVQALEDSLAVISPLRNEVERARIKVMSELGNSRLSAGNKQEAEKHFLSILRLPWYSLTEGNGDIAQLLVTQFIEAARGLIECRRGNLEALRQIKFGSLAIEDAVEDEFRAAIVEAGGHPSEVPNAEEKASAIIREVKNFLESHSPGQ